MNKENEKSKLNNFIVQGGILALTGVLVRVLGLAKRIPQAYIIGDIGNSYYSAAYEIYNVVYTIAAYGIPLSVSKLVSARVSKGEYKNANKVFNCAMTFAIIMGLVSSLFVFFFSDGLSALLKEPMSSLALKVLSPTLFFVCLLAVFRGYFQGLGSMVPTAISQLIEQIVLIIVSLTGAYLLMNNKGTEVGLIRHNEYYKYAYGAAGSTLGTVAGSLCGLIFLYLLYKAQYKKFKKKIYRDSTDTVETTFFVFRCLLLTIVPVVVSSFVNNISNFMDQFIFSNMCKMKGLDEIRSVNWGIYSGKYSVLINVPIAISAAMGASSVPTIAGLMKRKEYDDLRSKIGSVFKITMMVAIPCAAGFIVLAPSLMWFIFSTTEPIAPTLLRIGAAGVVFFSFSTLSNGILQGMSRMIKPITHGLIALLLHATLLFCLLNFTSLNIYAVALSNNFFSLFICAMNLYSISKELKYRQEVKKTFIAPIISSLIMSGVIFLATLVTYRNGFTRVGVLINIFIGIITYFISMLLLRAVSKDELQRLPGGSRLYRFLNKMHIMR